MSSVACCDQTMLARLPSDAIQSQTPPHLFVADDTTGRDIGAAALNGRENVEALHRVFDGSIVRELLDSLQN